MQRACRGALSESTPTLPTRSVYASFSSLIVSGLGDDAVPAVAAVSLTVVVMVVAVARVVESAAAVGSVVSAPRLSPELIGGRVV